MHSDTPPSSYPTGSLTGSSPLVPMSSRTRRDSVASGESPLRARRSSLSTNQPQPPHLPLAAAASVNASMRAGSPGPATTARDSAASRRKSVVADLAMADDRLPPPAEIATSDRKPSLSESMHKVPSLSFRDNNSTSPAVSPNPFAERSRGSRTGSPRMSGIEPTRTSMSTSDPFRQRAPSIGEVHQQMEQEQEAQVNRLLLQIHQQQMQIDALKRQSPNADTSTGSSTAISDDISSQVSTPLITPTSNPIRAPPTPERAHSSGSASTTTASTMPAARGSPSLGALSRPPRSSSPMSFSLNKTGSSRTSSRPASPSVRSIQLSGAPGPDEAKYWQAEAGNLERENAILKARIMELERQAGSLSKADSSEGNFGSHRSSSLATESMVIDG